MLTHFITLCTRADWRRSRKIFDSHVKLANLIPSEFRQFLRSSRKIVISSDQRIFHVFEISNVHNERNINLKFVILVRIRLNGFSGDYKSKK